MDGEAEVTPRRREQIVTELHRQRPVEPVVAQQLGVRLRAEHERRVLTATALQLLHRIAGEEARQGEVDDEQRPEERQRAGETCHDPSDTSGQGAVSGGQ